MKREDMDKIIKFELGYIPKGPKGSAQNKLRFYYNVYRRRGLVKGRQREESLKDAINKLKEECPDFNPMFDKDFFQTPKKSIFQKLMDRLERKILRSQELEHDPEFARKYLRRIRFPLTEL